MRVSDRVVVGRVGRPHGLDGSFVVEDASDDPRWFKVGAKLLVGDGELEVVGARQGGRGRPVIRLAGDAPRGSQLEVLREALPPTAEDEYYAFELVGLEVIEDDRPLGRVKAVRPGVANDSLELEDGQLLPLIGDCVLNIDLEIGRILVAPGFSDPG
jgi:16S rRNA processing protein RimM